MENSFFVSLLMQICHFFHNLAIFFSWKSRFFSVNFVSSNSVCDHICDKEIGLLLRGCPILSIIRMMTDRIGLHSVLLPLLTVLCT